MIEDSRSQNTKIKEKKIETIEIKLTISFVRCVMLLNNSFQEFFFYYFFI